MWELVAGKWVLSDAEQKEYDIQRGRLHDERVSQELNVLDVTGDISHQVEYFMDGCLNHDPWYDSRESLWDDALVAEVQNARDEVDSVIQKLRAEWLLPDETGTQNGDEYRANLPSDEEIAARNAKRAELTWAIRESIDHHIRDAYAVKGKPWVTHFRVHDDGIRITWKYLGKPFKIQLVWWDNTEKTWSEVEAKQNILEKSWIQKRAVEIHEKKAELNILSPEISEFLWGDKEEYFYFLKYWEIKIVKISDFNIYFNTSQLPTQSLQESVDEFYEKLYEYCRENNLL